jgi:hypothetical protein
MLKFNYLLPLSLAVAISPSAMAQTSATAVAPAPAPAPSAAAAVVAAAPSAATPAPAPACELHIWPAARVGAVTQGMGASFGLLGALVDASAHADQNKRDQAFITAALDAHSQAKALRDLDLPTLLHLPASAVIIHDQGIDLKTDNTNRLSDSSAKCYAEFVVRSLNYFKNVAYSGQMRTFLSIRRFDGATIKADFRDSKHEDLDAKLPKEGEDTGPATDALIHAFEFDVTFFANKFVKQQHS